MSEILTCEALTKCYDKDKTALDGVDLHVNFGRIVGLLGPNGSGKTTLLKLANGLLQPTEGRIRIAGMAPGPETKELVSYLPDADWLPDWMRVEELVEMFRDFYGTPSQAKAYIGFDADIDPLNYCRRAEELFELYQVCANRRQIETICLSYLRMLEATKVSSTGHLYFIPRQHMEKVDTFETFIEQLSAMNQNDNGLSVNSFYIIDDAKQRDKMTEEFYSAVKKEIALYQEKADYLIQSGNRSPAIMERWINKIATLEQKKQHYEEILRRELDGLDDEFETLRLLSQELSVRANGRRFRKAA